MKQTPVERVLIGAVGRYRREIERLQAALATEEEAERMLAEHNDRLQERIDRCGCES